MNKQTILVNYVQMINFLVTLNLSIYVQEKSINGGYNTANMCTGIGVPSCYTMYGAPIASCNLKETIPCKEDDDCETTP